MAYIKKKPIVEFITKGLNNPDKDKAFGHDAIEILAEIEYAPTADVEEVRHGEWEQNPYCKRIYFCSECGRHIEDGSCNPYEHFPYCHCGAKMDGGKKE